MQVSGKKESKVVHSKDFTKKTSNPHIDTIITALKIMNNLREDEKKTN